MAQFDWFAISGYWAISQYIDLGYQTSQDIKLGILFSLQNVRLRLIKKNKPLIKTNKSLQKVLSCLFLECSHVVYTKTIIHQALRIVGNSPQDRRSHGLFPAIHFDFVE